LLILTKEGFGSFIANHVIKEKFDRYHKESMVPPKLGDVWEPRIYVTIGKITLPVVLDLGSSVSAIPKSLCDHLDLPPIEKCDIDLKLDDCYITNAYGRVNIVLVELHMILCMLTLLLWTWKVRAIVL
jgi:hypothetical protein